MATTRNKQAASDTGSKANKPASAKQPGSAEKPNSAEKPSAKAAPTAAALKRAAAGNPAESRTEVTPKTAARPSIPTKPDPRLREKQLQKHNPAQGTPSIRRNLEAGKPKEQRTNRGAKLPHDAPD